VKRIRLFLILAPPHLSLLEERLSLSVQSEPICIFFLRPDRIDGQFSRPLQTNLNTCCFSAASAELLFFFTFVPSLPRQPLSGLWTSFFKGDPMPTAGLLSSLRPHLSPRLRVFNCLLPPSHSSISFLGDETLFLQREQRTTFPDPDIGGPLLDLEKAVSYHPNSLYSSDSTRLGLLESTSRFSGLGFSFEFFSAGTRAKALRLRLLRVREMFLWRENFIPPPKIILRVFFSRTKQ